MESVLLSLVLLGLLAFSGVIARYVRVPALFVQIGVGCVAGFLLPVSLHVEFDPGVFMLLFVPPLLFADGWGMPKREFRKYFRLILFMAFGLVFFTVAVLGFFIHWLVPSLPMAGAFALAAVLSPTDAVALEVIARGRQLPERVARVLRGEALLNDASGLVSFKFAVAALVTGVFSLGEAIWGFVLIGAGGVLVGLAVAWCFARLLAKIQPRSGHGGETTTEGVLLLLLPFVSYLAAEHLMVSGIMAAVMAGMYMSQSKYFHRMDAGLRIESRFTWEMLGSVLNGVIFVLLGFYLPVAARQTDKLGATAEEGLAYVLGLALMMAVALVTIRAVWVGGSMILWSFYDRWRGHDPLKVSPLAILLISVAGVRGAITLAGVLTVPLVLGSGEKFQERGLMITLAVGVILWSLLMGYLGVPAVLKLMRLPENDPALEELHMARAGVARAAIQAVEERHAKVVTTLDETAAKMHARVLESLKTHYGGIADLMGPAGAEKERRAASVTLGLELQMAAIAGAREELGRLRESQEINDETYEQVTCDLDMREAYLREILR